MAEYEHLVCYYGYYGYYSNRSRGARRTTDTRIFRASVEALTLYFSVRYRGVR